VLGDERGKLAKISDANHGAFAIVSVLCVPVQGFFWGRLRLLHIWGVKWVRENSSGPFNAKLDRTDQ
jgi:hypothetical protein